MRPDERSGPVRADPAPHKGENTVIKDIPADSRMPPSWGARGMLPTERGSECVYISSEIWALTKRGNRGALGFPPPPTMHSVSSLLPPPPPAPMRGTEPEMSPESRFPSEQAESPKCLLPWQRAICGEPR